MNKQKIPPQFKSYEAEAEFWDTHDITDYAKNLKPLSARYTLQPSQGITVRFKVQDLGELRKVALRKGMGVTTLIRMATMDYLYTSKRDQARI